MKCDQCALLQLKHSVDPGLMYTDAYGYASGVNETMVEHLGGLVDDIAQKFNVHAGQAVLDIACNDGTLLKTWEKYGVERHGVDPVAADVPGCSIVKDYFGGWWPKNYFKVITSVAVLYDLEDPSDFVQHIADCLAPDGVWAVEVQYAGEIFAGKWDQICHEHLCYYGLTQVRGLAHGAGLFFAGAELNDSNGGSLRAYFTKTAPRAQITRGLGLIHEENLPFSWNTRGLASKIWESAENINRVVRSYDFPYVVGASTKGNVILQVAGLGNNDIVAAIDRNRAKIGRSLPGSRIPIIGENDRLSDAADGFLVLPYHFRKSILRRMAPSKVPFIFPLPTVSIVCE